MAHSEFLNGLLIFFKIYIIKMANTTGLNLAIKIG